MKKLTILLSLLAAFPAFSSSTNNFNCTTEFPTTSIVGKAVDKEYVVQVYHHNGFNFMPLHSGIITPNDIDNMTKKAQIFSKLGDHYEFKWDLAKCKEESPGLISCIGGKETKINGVKVRPFSLTTSTIRTENYSGVYENAEASILMDIGGESQFMEMRYEKNECYFWR